MAGQGREVGFHGAFATKAKAKAKERDVPGAYIERVKIKGKTRYLVLTRNSPGRVSVSGAKHPGGRRVIRPDPFQLPNFFG